MMSPELVISALAASLLLKGAAEQTMVQDAPSSLLTQMSFISIWLFQPVPKYITSLLSCGLRRCSRKALERPLEAMKPGRWLGAVKLAPLLVLVQKSLRMTSLGARPPATYSLPLSSTTTAAPKRPGRLVAAIFVQDTALVDRHTSLRI